MTDTDFEILLNIDHIGNAQEFDDPKEILHQQGMKDFFELIHQTLQEAKMYNPENKSVSFSRRQNTITISGSRGSGKTTFLLNMLDTIKRQDKTCPLPLIRDDANKIKVLEILDPTLIEDKEHVFINIIARIKEMVDDKYPDEEIEKDRDSYNIWRKSLKDLAGGLTALDGVGGKVMDTDAWMDPIHIMEKGLLHVRHSNKLEKNFHLYVHQSLKLLDKDAFLLPLDDIDTKFESGWQVLEVLRKYLTTPQLITVLSGDLELYSKLVRKQQWDNFGDRLLKQEKDDQKNYLRLVDQLEEQYLLKILKPERRVLLMTIGELLKKNPNKIGVKFPKDKTEESFNTYFNRLCEKGLQQRPLSHEVGRLYQDTLLNSPIRFVSQLLLAHHRNKYNDEYEYKNLTPRVPDLFRQPLHNLGFPDHFFQSLSTRTYLNTVVVTLAKKGALETGYTMLPKTVSQSTNLGLIALSCLTTDMIVEHPSLMLDYIVKLGLTREITRSLPVNADLKLMSITEYLEHTQIESGSDALKHTHLSAVYLKSKDTNKEISPAGKDIFSRLGTIQARVQHKGKTIENEELRNKIITPLYGLSFPKTNILKEAVSSEDLFDDYFWIDEIDKRIIENANVKDISKQEYIYDYLFQRKSNFIMTTIDEKKGYWARVRNTKNFNLDKKPSFYFHLLSDLTKSLTSWQSVFIPPLFSTSQSATGERTVIYCAHSLLAVIGKFLEKNFSDQIEYNAAVFNSIMNELATPNESPLPTRLGGHADFFDKNERETDYEDNISQSEVDEFDAAITNKSDFERLLHDWAKKSIDLKKGKVLLTPHFVGRISDRFHCTLDQMDQTLEAKHHALGFMTHRYIVAFLNAVLVEEAIFRDIQGMKIKYPVTSDYIFVQNLKTNEWEDLSFFKWLFACPIWSLFLQIYDLRTSEINTPTLTSLMKIYLDNLEKTGLIADKEKEDEGGTTEEIFLKLLKVDFYGVSGVFDNLFAPLNSVLLRNVGNTADDNK